MPVVVKKFRVRAREKTYFPGEIIFNLTKEEEKELVNAGYCEYVKESRSTKTDKKTKVNENEKKSKEQQEPEEDGPNTSHPLIGEEQ